MSDISNILKSVNTSNKTDETLPLIHELHNITSQSLKKLQGIRKDLTEAYIASQHIIINDNNQYAFQPERDVRENNKQNLDLDKTQREEEKILKNILSTIDSVIKPSAIQNNTDISVLKSNTNNKSHNIFTKIKNLILKLVSTLRPKSKDVNTIDTNSETKLTPMEVMSQNINNITMYQEELDQRTKVLNNMPILQDAIKALSK